MPLSIRNPEVDRLARDLASATGKTMTEAIHDALKAELARLEPPPRRATLEELMAIAEECAALPVLDDRTDEEILGYDENGLPT